MKIISWFLAVVMFASCTKYGGGVGNGVTTALADGCFTSFHLTLGDSDITEGDDVTIYASEPYGLYKWSGPNGFFADNSTNGGPNYLVIPSIKISQSGWYHCGGSGGLGCSVVGDSIYVNVKYQQASPPCSLTSNTITNSIGMPDVSNVYVRRGVSADLNSIYLSAYAYVGLPEYEVYFKGSSEPKDGVYTTKDIYAFDDGDDNNTVNLACIYGVFYLTSDIGQKVYVSHVNGKLRVSWCGVAFHDSGISGKVSGQMTEH